MEKPDKIFASDQKHGQVGLYAYAADNVVLNVTGYRITTDEENVSVTVGLTPETTRSLAAALNLAVAQYDEQGM